MIKPIKDRIVVKRKEPETKTASGIILQAEVEQPDEGTVVAVGSYTNDKGQKVELDVKVGDVVVFGKYAGQTVTIDGEELIIMREADIVGVIE